MNLTDELIKKVRMASELMHAHAGSTGATGFTGTTGGTGSTGASLKFTPLLAFFKIPKTSYITGICWPMSFTQLSEFHQFACPNFVYSLITGHSL